MLDDIKVMKGLVRVLSPLIKDDLGVLIDPLGNETIVPAIVLADSTTTPSSTYPRVVISYIGSPDDNYLTERKVREEVNPDYDSGDPESQEKLYYIDHKTQTQYALQLQIDSGDSTEVLTEERLSASTIGRKIRQLLKWESTRASVHTEMDSGLSVIIPEQPVRAEDGTILTNASNVTITFSALDVLTEQVDGVIEGVNYKSSLYRVDETDPEPIETDRSVTAPDEYINS